MVPFKVNLENKVAVVTGGGGVLCSAMAQALAECGASVALIGRTLKTLETAAERISKAGGKALPVSADVTDPEALRQACKTIEETWASADILINGAGGNDPRGNTAAEYLLPEQLENTAENLNSFFSLDPDGLRFVLDLNLIGTLLPTQIFSRGMAEKKNGVIINISSMASILPLTKVPAYSAAKAAVNNLTQWLAVHFSRTGIRVNAIAPGFFLTNQNRSLMTNPDGTWTDRALKILDHIPFQRLGAPEELLGTLLWLADSSASGYVNGTVIPVDGGFSAFSGI